MIFEYSNVQIARNVSQWENMTPIITYPMQVKLGVTGIQKLLGTFSHFSIQSCGLRKTCVLATSPSEETCGSWTFCCSAISCKYIGRVQGNMIPFHFVSTPTVYCSMVQRTVHLCCDQDTLKWERPHFYGSSLISVDSVFYRRANKEQDRMWEEACTCSTTIHFYKDCALIALVSPVPQQFSAQLRVWRLLTMHSKPFP